MLAAHMDEVGLMVKTITKEGFIQFTKMGGIDDRILAAQKVVVFTKKGLPRHYRLQTTTYPKRRGTQKNHHITTTSSSTSAQKTKKTQLKWASQSATQSLLT